MQLYIGGNIWVLEGSGEEFSYEDESTVMERRNACVRTQAAGRTGPKRSRSS